MEDASRAHKACINLSRLSGNPNIEMNPINSFHGNNKAKIGSQFLQTVTCLFCFQNRTDISYALVDFSSFQLTKDPKETRIARHIWSLFRIEQFFISLKSVGP